MNVRIASVTSGTPVNDAQRMAWRVMIEDNDSTRFIHEKTGRGDVRLDTGVGHLPLPDLLTVVSARVVDHEVQMPFRLGLGDDLEDLEELHLTMPRIAGIGHVSSRDLKCGQQDGGALSWVVMQLLGGLTVAQRQDRLAAVQRRDLAVAAHAPHDGVVRRVEGGEA